MKRFSNYMKLFICFTIVVSMMPLQWTGAASATGLPYAVDIARSDQHSLVLKSDGTVWSWGGNWNGQLGDGTFENRITPVQVQDSRGEALSGIIKIATGSSYSLALKSDGTVWSWGDTEGSLDFSVATVNDKNSAVQIQDSKGIALSDITMISAGESHSLALKSDGTVWSWGANWDGQLGNGTSERYKNNSVQVVDSEGIPLSDITMISAGESHSLALKSDGTAWAWGGNWDGQLGDGTDDESRNTPVQVQGSNGTYFNDITMISAGESHSLALKSDGTVWSWGANWNGQLGDGTQGNKKSIPVQVQDSEGIALSGITKISAGAEHNLALSKDDGAVWSWGFNNDARLGNGTRISSNVAVPTGFTGATSIVAGSSSSLALKQDGSVWTWGTSEYHGDGMTFNKNLPVQATVTGSVYTVANGRQHSLAVTKDGTVWSWGNNASGQLGDGTNEMRDTVVQTSVSGAVYEVAAGDDYSLALMNDGTIWGWGNNWAGQLGNGTLENSMVPMQVKDSQGIAVGGFTKISAGSNYSLAVKNDGTVWSWGDNGSGQLGDGTPFLKKNPIQVRGLDNVVAVAAGTDHSLALKRDGTVWAWGNNWSGQLGDGMMFSTKYLPVQVKDNAGGLLSGITMISAGANFSSALKNDGTVWTWGYNRNGELGNGIRSNTSVPVQVRDSEGTGYLSGIVSIKSDKANHTLALTSDGTVWSWGSNWQGQLGNGTTMVEMNFPVQVKDSTGTSYLSDISAIAVGREYSFAVSSSGKLWAWGAADDNRLSDGTSRIKRVPTPLSAFPSVSANNDLSGLSLSQGILSPEFIAGTTSYNATVGYDVSSLKITPAVGDGNAVVSISVNGESAGVVKSGEASEALALNVGANTITVVVSAQNGATKTYTVIVARDAASSQADLSGLTLSEGTLNPAFAADKVSYNTEVGHVVSNLKVTPTVAATSAVVSVSVNNGPLAIVTSGEASESLALNEGTNTITVLVTAQDRTTKTYLVTVTRATSSITPPDGGNGGDNGNGGGDNGNGGGNGNGGNAATPPANVTSTDGKLTLPSGAAGEVSLNNEVLLSIPVGASLRELNVTISKLTNTQGLLTSKQVLISPVFEILKNFSENFSKKVTLSFAFDSTGLKNNQTIAVFYYDEVKKEWIKVEGGKITGNRIAVDVDHFTKYAVFAVDAAVDTTPTPVPTEIILKDITGHWAEAKIKQAVGLGIVNGYTDGTFKPGNTVTRAEFSVMLMNALKPEEAGAKLTFTDAAKIGTWAQSAVAQAVQAGIINGYEDGSFRPNDKVTRAEVAVMVAKALKLSTTGNVATSFADDKTIPVWSKAAVAALKDLGIVNGTGTNAFNPQVPTTRAEAVIILLNMLAQSK